jgi:hypothetical protein
MIEWLLIAMLGIVGLILFLNRRWEWSQGIAKCLFLLFMLWGCTKTHPVQTKETIDFFKDLGDRVVRAYDGFTSRSSL